MAEKKSNAFVITNNQQQRSGLSGEWWIKISNSDNEDIL